MKNTHYDGKPSFQELVDFVNKLGHKVPEKTKKINIFYDAKIKKFSFSFDTK